MRCLVVISVLTVFGCAGTSLRYTPTQQSTTPVRVRPAAQVEVFMTTPPKRPHVKLGIVESQQEEGSSDGAPEVIAKMRAFAGQHGCDGLVIFANNNSVSETMLAPGGGSRVYTLSGYRAYCIAYVADAAPTPAPAPKAPDADLPVVCVPNATQVCYGPGACRGGQSCAADGRSWSSCDCGPSASPSQPAAAAP
jgi:hypothetical protein